MSDHGEPPVQGATWVEDYERAGVHGTGYWSGPNGEHLEPVEVTSASPALNKTLKKSGMKEIDAEDRSSSDATRKSNIGTAEGTKAQELWKACNEKPGATTREIWNSYKKGRVKAMELEWVAERKVKHMPAADPDTPPELLDVLGRQRGTGLRRLVTVNENTPADTLTYLSHQDDALLREYAASNPNTPPDLLRNLSIDKDGMMAKAVAANENTPPDVLSILAKNDDETVKIEVVRNHSTPEETLRELAEDPDWNVRETVSYNVNTPKELRDYLRQARWRRTGEDLEAGEGQ